MTLGQESSAPALDFEIVDLSVPADPAYLSVMRSATAGLGTHLNLTLDEIEDLQIAVDEACALVLGTEKRDPGDDELLSTSFTVDSGVLSVKIDGPATTLPGKDNFAWTMLHALSSDVRAGGTGSSSWITLTCRGRGVAS